jgi:bifunctional DNA-binding transcriptional regulator/antitoxin component of YhaV-PrlF toxin-antitoxin module
VAYKYNGKTHSKYLITLPEEAVNALKWEAGAELKESIEGKKLVLVSLGKQEPKAMTEPRMTYEEFRDSIQKELKKNADGLTWTEIRVKLKLPQKVPNNKWVRRMEKDIGLLRVRDLRGVVWRVN